MHPANKLETEIKAEWQMAGVVFFLQIGLFLTLYYNSIRSAVELWSNTGAYNHCFLIAPIAAYLIYCDKDRLAGLVPRPSPWGVAVAAAAALLWWLSYMSGIAEGEHFALVGLIEGMLLMAFGPLIFRRLAIPFLYLFLMVPTGTFLLPILQKITAASSAWLLDLSGIDTFRDGLLIEVPTGSYVVAPGCAGLNFLLASLALSVAYADLVYCGWRRRLTFVAAMLALAVVGNILRVYLIIGIAHISGNVGNILDDHVLYGWGFFSLLILAAMSMGYRFRQDPIRFANAPEPSASAGSFRRLAAWVGAGGLVAVALIPSAQAVSSVPIVKAVAPPSLSCGAYAGAVVQGEWLPGRRLVDALGQAACQVDGVSIHVALAELRRPLRKTKLYGLERWLSGSEEWLETDRQVLAVVRSEETVSVLAQIFRVEDVNRTLWSVRWVEGRNREPGLDTAGAELAAELQGHRRGVLLVMEADGPPEQVSGAMIKLLRSLQLDTGATRHP